MTAFRIRAATVADAHACREIYRPYIENSTLTFEYDVPTLYEVERRIASALDSHTWLVAESAGAIAGYANAKDFSSREAYQWSCETGIYLSPDFHGRGLGRALYQSLLDHLAAQGFRIAVGRIAVPNDPSIALHEALGFETSGTLRSIGWKLDAWIDVVLMQKDLAPGMAHPPTLQSPAES